MPRKRFGRFAVQAQDQHAGLTGPAVAGVLAYPVNECQTPFFEAGFQLLLSGFVFAVTELSSERIPGRDVHSVQDIAVCHQLFQFRAGLANIHRERLFVMDDVIGFGEGLVEFGVQVLRHRHGLVLLQIFGAVTQTAM